MDNTTEELAARLVAVETMLAHLLAETMMREPTGITAGMIRQAVDRKPEALAVVKPERALIDAHLDMLLSASAMLARKMSTGR